MSKAWIKRDLPTGKYYADIDGGDSPAGGVDYSTDEQDTGLKWVDDKPVYQKTIALSGISITTETFNDVATLTGIDNLISIEAIGYESTTGVMFPDYRSRWRIYGDKLQLFSTSSAWSFTGGYVTVKYTKVD